MEAIALNNVRENENNKNVSKKSNKERSFDVRKLSLFAAVLLLTILLGSQAFAQNTPAYSPNGADQFVYNTNIDGTGVNDVRRTTNYNGTTRGPGTLGTTNQYGTNTMDGNNYNGITGRSTNTVRTYATTNRPMNWSWLGLLGLFGLIGLAGRNRNAEINR